MASDTRITLEIDCDCPRYRATIRELRAANERLRAALDWLATDYHDDMGMTISVDELVGLALAAQEDLVHPRET